MGQGGQKRVIIMGAAGKDFHVFNTCYRDREEYRVIGFTAAQIPNIDGRRYPPKLAGRLYPEGIPVFHERFLASLIREHQVQEAVFAYSDVSYDYIKQRESVARKAGADFRTFDLEATMLRSSRPVIAVCAVRTGAGKSPTSRKVVGILRQAGKKAAVIRHPMPYGDLERQELQRFESIQDCKAHNCTIEEMEEYEPHLSSGTTVFAGVDYEKILREVEREFEIIVWDGGNNDTPFIKPTLHITVADAIRAGHELSHFPGRINFEVADVIIINKVPENEAGAESIVWNAKRYNPKALIIKAQSEISVSDPGMIRGKRVLAIEDGPSVTHGETKFGAAYIAAERFGAAEVIDPRPFAKGSILKTFQEYPHIGPVLPAMGYGKRQIAELEETIKAVNCNLILIGTPVDLGRILSIEKPYMRVRYEIKEMGEPTLEGVLREKVLV